MFAAKIASNPAGGGLMTYFRVNSSSLRRTMARFMGRCRWQGSSCGSLVEGSLLLVALWKKEAKLDLENVGAKA